MQRSIILLIAVILLIVSCKQKTGIQDQSHSHNGTEELQPVVYTIYNDLFELFVEFNPLVVGDTTTFVTHYTWLSDFKPVVDGLLTITLQGPSTQNSQPANNDSPGIFLPEIIPNRDGVFELVFQLSGPGYNNEIKIDSVKIFHDLHDAQHEIVEEEYHNEGISFLKEQSWKIDFRVQKVVLQPWHEIIRTSGEILQAQGDEIMLTAHHSGVVMFRKANLLAGSEIQKGESLFNISSSDLVEDNIQEEYLKAKAQYEKSMQDFERAQLLIEDRLITESAFLEIKLKFDNASNTFNTFKKNYYQGGAEIRSPQTGFVKQVYVSEGQYVETGQPLASISKNKKLVIKADVSQKYFQQLGTIHSANFRTIYDDKVYDIQDLDGKLISYGKNVAKSAFYTPLYFEINNIGDFISGSFIEVFLIGRVINDAIIIPKSAIMEEIGNYYVFVQISGELYDKRDVVIGSEDGNIVRIISGIKENDRVVTQGANRIKLASMSSELPSHGHAH